MPTEPPLERYRQAGKAFLEIIQERVRATFDESDDKPGPERTATG